MICLMLWSTVGLAVLFALTTTVAGAVGATMVSEVVTIVIGDTTGQLNRPYLRHVDLNRLTHATRGLPVGDTQVVEWMDDNRLVLVWSETGDGANYQHVSVWDFRTGDVVTIHSSPFERYAGSMRDWGISVHRATDEPQWVFTDPHTNEIFLVRGDDFIKQHLLTLQPDDTGVGFPWPEWSLDGRIVTYRLLGTVYIIDIETKTVDTLSAAFLQIKSSTWTTDSRWWLAIVENYPDREAPDAETTSNVIGLDTHTGEQYTLFEEVSEQAFVAGSSVCSQSDGIWTIVRGESLNEDTPYAVAHLSLPGGELSLVEPLPTLPDGIQGALISASVYAGCERIRIVFYDGQFHSIEYDLNTKHMQNVTSLWTIAWLDDDGTRLVVDSLDANPIQISRYTPSNGSLEPYAELYDAGDLHLQWIRHWFADRQEIMTTTDMAQLVLVNILTGERIYLTGDNERLTRYFFWPIDQANHP